MLFGLMILTGGLDFLFASGSIDNFSDSTSNTKRMLSLLVVYMISVVFLILQPTKQALNNALNPILLLIAVLPIISILWSLDPGLSGKRSVAHLLTLIFILVIASRVTMEEFFRAFIIVLAATSVISLLLVVASPEIGVSQNGDNIGSWRGGLGHKANMGRVCVLGLVVAIFFPAKDDVVMNRLRWITIIILGVIIIGTQSRIAWISFVVAMMVALVFKAMHGKTKNQTIRLIKFLLAGVLVAIPVAVFFEDAIYASGRDLTFSGRTALWESAVAVAQLRHPLSGAGFGAFWTEASSIDVFTYLTHWKEMPSHGHNGYLDAWLEMGLTGIGTLMTVTLVSFIIIVRRINDPENGDYWFMLLILHIVFVAINIGGTISFKHSEIFWILFLAPVFFRSHGTSKLRKVINRRRRRKSRSSRKHSRVRHSRTRHVPQSETEGKQSRPRRSRRS